MYLDYRKNDHSANGEDGILEKLFSDLNITNGIVCEFGAWDGLNDSNTAMLWTHGYQAVLIENDKNRFEQLKQNTSKHDVECINVAVQGARKKGMRGIEEWEASDFPTVEDREKADIDYCIDNILEKSKFNITSDNFALMSIDIDSYDYYVFNSIEKYFPKVLILEVSSGYLPARDHISENDGCSIKSAYELGIEKGYKMVCHCGNVIFVRDDLVNKLPDYDYSIENLYQTPDDLKKWEVGE